MPLRNGKLVIEEVKHGIVCFTFDDGHYKHWLEHLELFRRFNARGTFFYNREIDAEAADSMKILRQHDHSVGLHTISHRDAVDVDMEEYCRTEILPQINSAARYGVEDLNFFAYPNNRHTPESDTVLSRYFTRFRAGLGIKLPKGFHIADQDRAFMPLEKISSSRVLGGCGIGEFYASTLENLDAALARAAAENKLIVFFSHDIAPDAKSVHMPTEFLTHLLESAATLQMTVAGFNELP